MYSRRLANQRPHSRICETEADYIGLFLMARACYDPKAAVSLWKKMKEFDKMAPPEFLSTHPSSESRIETLRRLLPEADLKREAAGCDHASHLTSFWRPKHW